MWCAWAWKFAFEYCRAHRHTHWDRVWRTGVYVHMININLLMHNAFRPSERDALINIYFAPAGKPPFMHTIAAAAAAAPRILWIHSPQHESFSALKLFPSLRVCKKPVSRYKLHTDWRWVFIAATPCVPLHHKTITLQRAHGERINFACV